MNYPYNKLKAITSLMLFCALSMFASAQDFQRPFNEYGLTISKSFFLGDLGGGYGKGTTFLKDLNWETSKVSYGVHYTHFFNDWLAVRLAGNYLEVEADDKYSTPYGNYSLSRQRRNLNFRSNIYEATLTAEIYPTVFFEGSPEEYVGKFRPYGIIGVGAFYYNPQGLDESNNTWVDLKPLKTEGQGMASHPDVKDYSLFQMNIPMGAGIRYHLSDKVSLSAEVIHRFTFTDYIDDVSNKFIAPSDFNSYFTNNPSTAALAIRMAEKSKVNLFTPGLTRGDNTDNDSYFTFGFKLSFRISGGGDDNFDHFSECPRN
jgi:hypothetical protein